jgi:nucleoid-associated protein
MPSTIRNVGVHDLRRTATGLEVVLGRDGLPVNAVTQRVVDNLDDMYSKRSSKAHGRFSDDVANYPTSGYFMAYLNGPKCGEFGEFTSRSMATLLAKARRVPNAGAGHVFFAHFARDGREFVLIAIVNEKLGAALTNSFEVQDITHLDLDGFRFAGRVDMTSWQAGDERYISFLRGRGDIAEYFKEFLGCVSPTTDKQSTEELVVALKGYADHQAMEATARDDFLARAKTALDRVARTREPLAFQALANELVPDSPEVLAEYLADPDRKLGDGFVPNTRILGTLVKFRARTRLWSIEMDRSAIRDGEIRFDPEENTLTILTLPADLTEQLRAEFADDAAD